MRLLLLILALLILRPAIAAAPVIMYSKDSSSTSFSEDANSVCNTYFPSNDNPNACSYGQYQTYSASFLGSQYAGQTGSVQCVSNAQVANCSCSADVNGNRSCSKTGTSGSSYISGRGFIFAKKTCPSGGSPDTTKPLSQQCPDAPPPDPCSSRKGQAALVGRNEIQLDGDYSVAPASYCPVEECIIQFNNPVKGYGGCVKYDGNTSCATYVKFSSASYTGSSCKTTTQPNHPKFDLCQKGQCPVGEINGQTICGQCKTQTESTEKKTSSTGADGTTKEGSEKSETTCDGETCTTTTTKTDGNGNTTSEQKTEGKANFCKDNPGTTICQTSQIFSSCGSFECHGDAIQCAIARQQNEAVCSLLFKQTEESQFGDAVMKAGIQPKDHPISQAGAGQILSLSNALGSAASGGGGCMSDFEVAGVTVPLSNTCDGLNALGLACLGITLIWAARFVFSG